MIRFSVTVILAAAFLLPTLSAPSPAQPNAGAAKVQPKQAKKQVKGRLPAYYAQIVDDGQRQRIYQIQASYKPKIDVLQAELDALVAQRDAEIRAVLTPEQQRRLDGRVAEAKAAKAAKAEMKADDKRQIAVPVRKAG